MAIEFQVRIFPDESRIEVSAEGPIPFEGWMILAEYASYHCARTSGAGFERALELIADGAMTYRERVEELPDGGASAP